jgi:hypothetical protein
LKILLKTFKNTLVYNNQGMKKEVLYLMLLISTFFSILLISNVFAYSWSPSAICYNIGHSELDLGLSGSVGGAYCTDLRIEYNSPGSSTYTVLSSDSGSCSDYYDQRCGEDRIRYMDTTSFEISWTSLKTICVSSGREGTYNFRLWTREQPGIPRAYCVLSPGLNVKWDGDQDWCEQSSCGNGAWLDTSSGGGWVAKPQHVGNPLIEYLCSNDCPGGWIYCERDCVLSSGDGCCSPRTMDDEFNYTNEDCDLIIGDHLCYYSKNPAQSIANDAEWLSHSLLAGQIVYEGCGNNPSTNIEDGNEYLATGTSWKVCDNTPWRQLVTALDANDAGPFTHEYICVDWLAPRRFSIAECNAHSSGTGSHGFLNWRSAYPGGINARGGQSVNVTGGLVYFCTNQSRWSTDLDLYSNAGNRGEFCNNARFPPDTMNGYGASLSSSQMRSQNQPTRWTGRYCCGETDDWKHTYPDMAYSVWNEYYTDDDRIPGQHPTDYPGACFNNWYQRNESFLTIYDNNNLPRQLDEVMIWHGTFQGCAIDHTAAMPSGVVCSDSRSDSNKPYEGTVKGADFSNFHATTSDTFKTAPQTNNFLLEIRDNPGSSRKISGQKLINDNKYCTVLNWSSSQSFYCSYLEKWVPQNPSSARTHLSFIPWVNESAQQAECCQPSECWDGNQCVSSADNTLAMYPHKIMNNRGDGFICKNGNWEWTYRKTSWDGSEQGYCLKNTQCLVSAAGEPSLTNVFSPNYHASDVIGNVNYPLCINDGEYYLDHYCEDGTWTSRTKYVALQLYNLAGSSDFVLYCDNYKKVLNNVDFILEGDFSSVEQKYFMTNPASGCQIYTGQTVPCANNVCVLIKNPSSTNPEIYVGTSINSRLNRTTSSGGSASAVYDIGLGFGSSLSNCASHERGSDSFVSCGDENLYYNGAKGLVIFTRGSPPSNIDYVSTLNSLFTGFIQTIVGWLTGGVGGDIAGYDYNVLDQMADDLFHELGQAYKIPNFHCENCTDSNSINDAGRVCGIEGNPRKIYGLSSLYLSKSGSKSIFGISEYQAPYDELTPSRYNGLVYRGFTEDICSSFDYAVGYKCEKRGNEYIISAIVTSPSLEISYHSLFDIFTGENWVFIAPSTRIH